MGVWLDGKIIYGGKIWVGKLLVDVLIQHDPISFAVLKEAESSDLEEVLVEAVEQWINERYPRLAVISASRGYDSGSWHYHLGFNLKISSGDDYTSQEVIEELSSVTERDLEDFRTVIKVLNPGSDGIPRVYATPDVS